MKNKLVKILTIGFCIFIGIGTAQAQTVSREEMKNLVLVAGYTGVGTFPAVVVARPKDAAVKDNKLVEKVYLLTASSNGWHKREVACARGLAMSTNGKQVWLITNAPSESGCFLAYDLSLSVDGGKTWKVSRSDGFSPSAPAGDRFEFLDIDARGNGWLMIWADITDDSRGRFFAPKVSNFIDLTPARTASETLPSPSRGNIAQITLNNFASDNANTLESKKTWLEKLAKTKEAKRREMPQ